MRALNGKYPALFHGLGLMLFCCLPLSGAVNMFLKVEGIDGEATVNGYEDMIETLNYSWGLGNDADGADPLPLASRAVFTDLSVIKYVDRATPDLFVKCAKGEHIPKVELFVTTTAGEMIYDFLVITIENCVVTSFYQSGSYADGRLTETVSFTYAKIKVAYTPLTDEGVPGATIDRTWNLQTNQQE